MGEYQYLWPLPDQYEETTEQIQRYHPGGLHPVHIDERYSSAVGQYRVLHKLGYGSYSHVWFGQTLASPNSRGVVLKLIASQCTGKTNEVEINTYLASRSKEDFGFRNFLFCHDTFQLHGPNGVHNVIVTEPAILLANLPSLGVELDEREVVRQMFHGLSFLHRHGVVHRDLHLGNIAVEFPFLRTSGVNEIMKASRHPICHPCVLSTAVSHPASLPAYLVEKAKFCERFAPLMREEASSIVVKLLDFGCAFRPGTNDVLAAEQGGPAFFLKAPECVLAHLLPDPTKTHSVTQDPSSHNLIIKEMPPKSWNLAAGGSSAEDNTSSTPPVDKRMLPSEVAVPRSPIHLAWSRHSDIWALGCSLLHFFSQRQHNLFNSGTPLLLIRDIATYLGPFSPTFRTSLGEAANEKVVWIHPPEGFSFPIDRHEAAQASAALDLDASQFDTTAVEGNWAQLEQKLIATRTPWRGESVDEASRRLVRDTKLIRDLFALMKQMLRWDPTDRISALDALDSELLLQLKN